VYYGSVDATPLFVMLLGELRRWGLHPEAVTELLSAADRALSWIAECGDRDRDGFVEYQRKTDRGIANQGWKDSFDGINFADGTLARAPIALASGHECLRIRIGGRPQVEDHTARAFRCRRSSLGDGRQTQPEAEYRFEVARDGEILQKWVAGRQSSRTAIPHDAARVGLSGGGVEATAVEHDCDECVSEQWNRLVRGILGDPGWVADCGLGRRRAVELKDDPIVVDEVLCGDGA
jgi:hypothetical protein